MRHPHPHQSAISRLIAPSTIDDVEGAIKRLIAD